MHLSPESRLRLLALPWVEAGGYPARLWKNLRQTLERDHRELARCVRRGLAEELRRQEPPPGSGAHLGWRLARAERLLDQGSEAGRREIARVAAESTFGAALVRARSKEGPWAQALASARGRSWIAGLVVGLLGLVALSGWASDQAVLPLFRWFDRPLPTMLSLNLPPSANGRAVALSDFVWFGPGLEAEDVGEVKLSDTEVDELGRVFDGERAGPNLGKLLSVTYLGLAILTVGPSAVELGGRPVMALECGRLPGAGRLTDGEPVYEAVSSALSATEALLTRSRREPHRRILLAIDGGVPYSTISTVLFQVGRAGISRQFIWVSPAPETPGWADRPALEAPAPIEGASKLLTVFLDQKGVLHLLLPRSATDTAQTATRASVAESVRGMAGVPRLGCAILTAESGVAWTDVVATLCMALVRSGTTHPPQRPPGIRVDHPGARVRAPRTMREAGEAVTPGTGDAGARPDPPSRRRRPRRVRP